MNRQISFFYLFIITMALLKATAMHGGVKTIQGNQATVTTQRDGSIVLLTVVNSKLYALELRKDSTDAYLFYIRTTKRMGTPPFLFGLKGTFSFASNSITMDTIGKLTTFNIVYDTTGIMTLNSNGPLTTQNTFLATLTCNGLDIFDNNDSNPIVYTFENGNKIKTNDLFTATNRDPNNKKQKGTFKMSGTISLINSPVIISPEDAPAIISSADGTLNAYNNDQQIGTLTVSSCTLSSEKGEGDYSYIFLSNVIKNGDIINEDITNQKMTVKIVDSTKQSLILTNNHYIGINIDNNNQSIPTIYDSKVTVFGKPVAIATLTTLPSTSTSSTP